MKTSFKPFPAKAETERQNNFKDFRTAVFACRTHYKGNMNFNSLKVDYEFTV